MRKLTFLFAALLSLSWGTMKAGTLTETFDDVTVTSRYLLSNGWVMVHNNGNYQGFGGSYDYQIKSGNYDGETGNSLSCDYSDNNEYVVISTKLSGTFTYYVKRSSSSNGTVTFFEATKDGDTFTVTTTQLATTSTTSSWAAKSFDLGDEGKYVAIRLLKSRIDQISATIYEEASGPALAVKDGSTKLTSPYAYNFGLGTAGTEKTFTLSNPGTADLGVSVSETGNFGATLSATTIAAGSEVTLTLTMPTATSSSEVTITPADGSGIDPFVINVSGTIRDANKVYESGFTALPEEWTTTGSWYYSAANGAYTTVWYLTSNARLITPLLTISEGETFFVEAKGYSTSNTSYQHLQMQYSADGTTWTNFGDEPALDPSEWNTFAFTGAPAGKYYIAINASQADVRMFYGGQLPQEPKMVVTQPASLDFGVITEATSKTFTIANTGRAELKGINVTSSNSSIFAITGAPTSLAAGASADVTITMAATTTGALSSDITVSATDMENVEFTVTGVVLPDGLYTEDFADGLPANWTNASWTFANGEATGKSSSAYLTTPKLIFSEGDMVVIKAKRYDSDTSDYLTVQGSSDNGATWTTYSKKLQNVDGLTYPDYCTIVLSDIPATVNKLRFVGFYVVVDEIAGLTYAPVLSVTESGTAVSTPASYDFSEATADATVTYNFANAGAGTINITNVTVTGDGAAAYSTNWTESVAAPFDLVITRTYDSNRTGAYEAVITVTTSEGDFVINVTGTDKAANSPELAVTLAGDDVATGATADFGTQLQSAPAAKTYTITNSGTGTLTGTIATSDDTQFTVSETSFSLGAAESMTFELALIYDENYGAKAATITIHPTNDGLEDVVINATASTFDPEAWTEDFAAGTLPTGWTATTWTVGTYSNYENKTTMALAPSSSTAGTLTTPCLTAKEGDVLTWDGYFQWDDEAMIVEYSDDNQETWTNICTMYGTENGEKGSAQNVNYRKVMSFIAPADGNYYLRFTSTYQNGVDNFAGFKLNLPDHIMAITASSIPTSGSYSPKMKQGQSFNATVTIKESRGVAEENITAKLYMGEEVIGTVENESVEANETKQITITATPTVAATEGTQMHIEVEYAGGTLSTTPETRYVKALVTLDLTEAEGKEITTGYSTVYDQVTLTRSFVAGWNTFVAPVSVTLSDIHADAVAYKFTGYADDILTFSKETTTLEVATPYLIYVPEKIDNKVFLWESPVIYSSYVSENNIRTTQGDIIFQGTYAPITGGLLDGKHVVGTQNGVTKLYKATASTTIKGFRAYFDTNGNEVKSLSFFDEATGVRTISAGSEEAEAIFDLMGRRMNEARKGVNIVNGKKVIIK